MNKNLTKKALVPAIAMVLASVIALSGVTYAWFTTGTTATIENLDVNVMTANGIQVSLDAVNWKNTISGEDIKNAILDATDYPERLIQYPTGEIAPVSTAGNVTNGQLEMFLGGYNDDGTLYSKAIAEVQGTSNVNYVAFDLFFQTQTEQTLSFLVGEGNSEVKSIDYATGADSTVLTSTAVRVALLPMGTKATPAEAQALKGDGTVKIWEPNATTHVDTKNVGEISYSGFAKAFASAEEKNLGDNVESVSTEKKTFEVVTLTPGITKVRVYIWLEGQDVDCVNKISNADFRTILSFNVPKAATTPSN